MCRSAGILLKEPLGKAFLSQIKTFHPVTGIQKDRAFSYIFYLFGLLLGGLMLTDIYGGITDYIGFFVFSSVMLYGLFMVFI